MMRIGTYNGGYSMTRVMGLLAAASRNIINYVGYKRGMGLMPTGGSAALSRGLTVYSARATSMDLISK
jgi:hypothetical protein